jgi:hypothetical protein
MSTDQAVVVGLFAVLVIFGSGTLLVIGLIVKRTKEKYMHRKELIATWRRELLPLSQQAISLPTEFGAFPFMHLSAYASLRPHLSKQFRERLEAERQIIQFIIEDGRIVGVVGDYPHKQLMEEIARLEREWKLV